MSASRAPTFRSYLLHAALPMLVGGLIYVLFRTPHLLMFQWFETLGIDGPIAAARVHTMPLADSLPEWIRFSVPDGSWVWSATATMSLIWHDKGGWGRWFWISLGAAIAIGSELIQLYPPMPGVFDPVDLVAYAVAHVAALGLASRTWSV